MARKALQRHRLRTQGRWQIAKEKPNYAALETTAGIHASTGPWLKARGVAAIGCDAISDVMPSGVESVFNPVHTLANAALGMPIFDHLQLDQAAEIAASLNRQTFLFSAAPLNIQGATGSPLTPMAIFFGGICIRPCTQQLGLRPEMLGIGI